MEECFTFFRSFHEVLECLSNKSYRAVMSALSKYALDGEPPELKGAEKAIFLAIKPQLDASKRRRDEWNEHEDDRSEHARKAARARWEKGKADNAEPPMPADTQSVPDTAETMPDDAQRCYKEKEEEEFKDKDKDK
ncbi:MAG: DUF6291 domain-containing protein [Treponema sp.]|jgi:hypothetical protein|nr:DUF6291 domain-containing protein [Treponema sp.]